MDIEARMTTMEANHQVLQEKFEKLEKGLERGNCPSSKKYRGPNCPDARPTRPKERKRGGRKTKVQFKDGTAASIPINSETVYNHDPEIEVTNVHGGMDAKELSLVSDLEMPLKFKTPEFEKFDGTTCPSAHLTMYCRKMSLFLDNEKLLIHCFQDSLIEFTARWKDLSTSMEQKPNKSFRQYAQRWREVAAQVQPPLLENEVTLLFVNTLKDDFYDRMLDHATKPFAGMVMTGELIQVTIKSGRIKGGNESREHFKKRDNEVSTTSSYMPGYSTRIIIGHPNHPTTPVAPTQNSSKQEM
ncbi:hypothetical protein V6N11_059038 [Hibiscus sabdariffa]|uniref:Retrotransposon gag domain-containing protein n=1 Tax=Hibiscus sabdariffa TaxID=183260 RepID=A0ABR2U670_9ROSI